MFLDEIGEVNEAIQVKLLRILQSRTFQRLGSSKTFRFDGKFIAATNRDLVAEMDRGKFREDFYYRLCADQIWTPSLAEQIASGDETLSELIWFIAKNLVGRDDAQALRDETLQWVKVKLGASYPWPGNVRELEQCVRNILIRREYLPARRRDKHKTDLDTALSTATLDVEALTRRYVTHIYFREGSYEAAGRVLEMDRRTVKAKVDAQLLGELEKARLEADAFPIDQDATLCCIQAIERLEESLSRLFWFEHMMRASLKRARQCAVHSAGLQSRDDKLWMRAFGLNGKVLEEHIECCLGCSVSVPTTDAVI